MDKWIGNFVEKYNEMIFENISSDVIRSFHYISFSRLPKGFRHLVSDHLFYYENLASNGLWDSDFNFIIVHRSTPFKFCVDLYHGILYIYVLVEDSKSENYDQIFIGKYLISEFLYGFVSEYELYRYQSQDFDNQPFDDDQFEIPF